MDNENNKQKAKVLRTYTSDMAEAIRQDEASVIKIALAEKARREREAQEKKAEGTNFTKTAFLLGGILLLAIAGATIYFLFFRKTEEVVVPVESRIESFLSYDSNQIIETSSIENFIQLITTIKEKENGLSGIIKTFFFVKEVGEQKEFLSPAELLSLANVKVPDSLLRALSSNYLFGKYEINQTIKETAPFLILEANTNNYNQAYASMLNWEDTMLSDLLFFFEIKLPEDKLAISYGSWGDLIIKNKDVRVLRDPYGKGLIYYSFVNKNSFVITTRAEALAEIIDRILTKNL